MSESRGRSRSVPIERDDPDTGSGLDGRQIFFLLIGSAVFACLVFAIGVLVGRRMERNAAAQTAQQSATDPLSILDEIATAEEALTFHRALAPPSPPVRTIAQAKSSHCGCGTAPLRAPKSRRDLRRHQRTRRTSRLRSDEQRRDQLIAFAAFVRCRELGCFVRRVRFCDDRICAKPSSGPVGTTWKPSLLSSRWAAASARSFPHEKSSPRAFFIVEQRLGQISSRFWTHAQKPKTAPTTQRRCLPQARFVERQPQQIRYQHNLRARHRRRKLERLGQTAGSFRRRSLTVRQLDASFAAKLAQQLIIRLCRCHDGRFTAQKSAHRLHHLGPRDPFSRRSDRELAPMLLRRRAVAVPAVVPRSPLAALDIAPRLRTAHHRSSPQRTVPRRASLRAVFRSIADATPDHHRP